jgi:hypothetical protein
MGVHDDCLGGWHWRAIDEPIRVANAVRDLDLEGRAAHAVRRASQAVSEQSAQGVADYVVPDRYVGHGDGPKIVELVAELLPLFPGEELPPRHRFAKRDIHGRQLSTSAGPAHRVLAIRVRPADDVTRCRAECRVQRRAVSTGGAKD